MNGTGCNGNSRPYHTSLPVVVGAAHVGSAKVLGTRPRLKGWGTAPSRPLFSLIDLV